MSKEIGAGDLLVLVADLDMEQAMRGLLEYQLRNHQDSYRVIRHPRHDPGCRTQAVEALRPYVWNWRYAMVIFDLDGSGSRGSREDTQREVERQLSANGWHGRSKTIVIDPELEAWVWGRSPVVAEILGWGSGYRALRSWLRSQNLWPTNHPKPPDPKLAMRGAMREALARRSPAKFYELGRRADARSCRDPAFGELRDTLQAWFPEVHDGEG